STIPQASPYPPPPPPPPPSPYVADPGLKNPYIRAQTPVQPPPIPPRRLFHIPDAAIGTGAGESGDRRINQFVTIAALSNPRIDLADPRSFLGKGADDRCQHPYFRTEWLQKVTNLTTVRTHQFAVWVTVGFFEVVRRGRPSDLIADQLGQEMTQ